MMMGLLRGVFGLHTGRPITTDLPRGYPAPYHIVPLIRAKSRPKAKGKPYQHLRFAQAKTCLLRLDVYEKATLIGIRLPLHLVAHSVKVHKVDYEGPRSVLCPQIIKLPRQLC